MTDTRNDLPPVNSPNFLEKVREALSTYLGNRGSKLDRGLTVRDLSDAGLVDLNPRWLQSGGKIPPIAGPGSAIGGADVYEPDLTPPPTPSGFAATAAISNLLVECDAQTYTQGHGHAKSRLYGTTWTSGPLPVFADAVVITEFTGTVAAHATNPATTWHLWLTWVTADGVESTSPAGGTNGVVVRTGEDVSSLVQAMTGPGNPFTILPTTTIVDGVTFPAGTYSTKAFILDAQITNAKIKNLAVDDGKIASVSAAKLTAGSIAVGQYIQSASYVPGSWGWRINGDGTAEFSGVVVRGTVYATAGQIGGITIASNAVRAGQTAFDTGSGFFLGAGGTFSLGNGSGSKLTWDGTSLNIVGGGTFSGALSAATGTFTGTVSGGQFTTGAYTGYAWPAAGNYGTYLGPSGLLIGNANNNKYLQVTQDGNIYSPGFDVENGTMTVKQANVINTLNIAGNAVTIPSSVYLASAVFTTNSSTLVDMPGASISFTSKGGRVLILVMYFDVTIGENYSSVYLYRDGTNLGSASAMIFSDLPGAGAHTYKLLVQGPITGGSNTRYDKVTMFTLETVR